MLRTDIERLPSFLQHGFRPFFWLGALWAAGSLTLWLSMLGGAMLPIAMDPLAWHRHEMLFGYLAAIIAAFLLTAVPNWTGRLPVRGAPLVFLILLWLAARLAVLTGGWLGLWPGMVLDVGFPLALAVLIAREILASGNRRNLPVVVLVSLLALADLLSHLEQVLGLPWDIFGDRMAIAVVASLVALIGGRITPSFTTNWLKAHKSKALPVAFDRLDQATLVLTGIGLLSWLLLPSSLLAGLALPAAAAGTMIRLVRWRGVQTMAEPLVLILHVGYGWLALGLALLGLSVLDVLPRTAALHALTAGSFGTMTLAVMTRAALGHTGRALTADRWTIAIYALVSLGALARVAAAFLPSTVLTPALHLAGLLWGGAFLLYAVTYAPVLLGPRLKPQG